MKKKLEKEIEQMIYNDVMPFYNRNKKLLDSFKREK